MRTSDITEKTLEVAVGRLILYFIFTSIVRINFFVLNSLNAPIVLACARRRNRGERVWRIDAIILEWSAVAGRGFNLVIPFGAEPREFREGVTAGLEVHSRRS